MYYMYIVHDCIIIFCYTCVCVGGGGGYHAVHAMVIQFL